MLLMAQVIALADYRAQLSEYLRNRMIAIAPNLTILVGELVGARLIAHAGTRSRFKTVQPQVQFPGWQAMRQEAHYTDPSGSVCILLLARCRVPREPCKAAG